VGLEPKVDLLQWVKSLLWLHDIFLFELVQVFVHVVHGLKG